MSTLTSRPTDAKIGPPDARGGGCWARVNVRLGPHFNGWSSCGLPPRKGMLTCSRHKHVEEAARALKEDLAKELSE
jgi:hypothetical protein